jgi:cell division protease FtsH
LILFWIFAVLSGISVFAWAYVFWGVGPIWAFVIAVFSVLLLRGIVSWVKRWLILTERIADDSDTDTRTVETNRYIFWRRAIIWGSVLAVVTVFTILFDLGQFILPLLGFAVQMILIFGGNFLILFGPFVLFGFTGRQSVQPGDANYDVRMEDVRGQKSAVNEMLRILRLIESGRNYVKAGGKRERGVLMVGPPGTGKTMLAKGIAASLHLPIITTTGSSFAGMFWGMDVINVLTLVRSAKKRAKRWGGCVIFIDEIDALGSRRTGMGGGGIGPMGMMGGGSMALNTLLVQMDGVDNPGFIKRALRRLINVTLDGLFVPRRLGAVPFRIPPLKGPRYNLLFIGATNRPSVLDEALTRPGRFGRQITFRTPTREDRKDIAALYFDQKKHDPDLDRTEKREEFARITQGYSPADIEQALSLALMYAFEDGRDYFVWADLREAMGNIESGLVQPVEYTEREKVAVARHEMGHAVAQRFFQPDHAPIRLSIQMRADGSLGRLQHSPVEEEFSQFRSQMAGRLRTIMGAIAAERVFYGENSNGVLGDLMQATQQATDMVGLRGMGPDNLSELESVRAMRFGEALISTAQASQSALEGGNFIAATLGMHNRRIVAQVIGAAYIDCWRLMYVNKDSIDLAAETLISHGELVGDEITHLLDSVSMRYFDASTPYPPDLPKLPRIDEEEEDEVRERRQRRTATGAAAQPKGAARPTSASRTKRSR